MPSYSNLKIGNARMSADGYDTFDAYYYSTINQRVGLIQAASNLPGNISGGGLKRH